MVTIVPNNREGLSPVSLSREQPVAQPPVDLAIADGIQIENFEQVYNELLPEVNFNEILETLIGVALDAVLGATEFEFPIGELLAESAGVPIGLTLRLPMSYIQTDPVSQRDNCMACCGYPPPSHHVPMPIPCGL